MVEIGVVREQTLESCTAHFFVNEMSAILKSLEMSDMLCGVRLPLPATISAMDCTPTSMSVSIM